MFDMSDKLHTSIRLPQKTWDKVDVLRKRQPGNVSRNTWVASSIQEKLDRDGDKPATEAGRDDDA